MDNHPQKLTEMHCRGDWPFNIFKYISCEPIGYNTKISTNKVEWGRAETIVTVRHCQITTQKWEWPVKINLPGQ